MVNGPLIPGLKEFDGPKKGVPRLVWWVIGIVLVVGVVIVLVGMLAGTGPLRSLGLRTEALQAVAYRPTTDDRVVQVAVAVPTEGLCKKDDVVVSAFARGNRIEISATRTSARNSACQPTGIAQDRVWVDVPLDARLGDRQVVREADRAALPRETSTGLK